MRKIIYAPLVALALIIGLAGCVPVAEINQPTVAAPSTSPTDEILPPSFAPEPEPEPELGNLAFGSAMTWDDGVSLSMSTGAAFVPSQYVTAPQPHNLRFTITVTNGSTENFDGYVYAVATSGGAPADQIFDSANGLQGPPSGVILPGQTITFDLGFSVADPNSIVISIQPSFEYEAAIFTNVAS